MTSRKTLLILKKASVELNTETAPTDTSDVRHRRIHPVTASLASTMRLWATIWRCSVTMSPQDESFHPLLWRESAIWYWFDVEQSLEGHLAAVYSLEGQGSRGSHRAAACRVRRQFNTLPSYERFLLGWLETTGSGSTVTEALQRGPQRVQRTDGGSARTTLKRWRQGNIQRVEVSMTV
jgi:hypothetical protein